MEPMGGSNRRELLERVGDMCGHSYTRFHSRFYSRCTPVPVSGKVLDPADVAPLVDSIRDSWLTTKRFTSGFQKALTKYLEHRSALFVNSGLSANLVDLSVLTSPKLGQRVFKERYLAISVAMGFQASTNPTNYVNHFIDSMLETRDSNSKCFKRFPSKLRSMRGYTERIRSQDFSLI